jgi:hypothetical protein
MKSHTGGCHCGAVRFRFDAPARVLAHECNCSICAKSGYLHLIVPAARFSLLSGSESLCEYRFGSGAARHLFCSRCGIKSFYVPRSNPDGYSINLRCVDEGSLEVIEVEAFDGRNWELNAASLAHLSVE